MAGHRVTNKNTLSQNFQASGTGKLKKVPGKKRTWNSDWAGGICEVSPCIQKSSQN